MVYLCPFCESMGVMWSALIRQEEDVRNGCGKVASMLTYFRYEPLVGIS